MENSTEETPGCDYSPEPCSSPSYAIERRSMIVPQTNFPAPSIAAISSAFAAPRTSPCIADTTIPAFEVNLDVTPLTFLISNMTLHVGPNVVPLPPGTTSALRRSPGWWPPSF